MSVSHRWHPSQPMLWCLVVAVTWPMPGQLDIEDKYVTQHYLWATFNSFSAMVMITYGVSLPRYLALSIAWSSTVLRMASPADNNALMRSNILVTAACLGSGNFNF